MRVTATEVKVILSTDLDDVAVDAFITTANILVDENLLNQSYSDALLTQIELWLSAHLSALHRDSRQSNTTQEETGDAQAEFGGETGLGLDFTRYGQHVKLLDKAGILAGLGQKTPVFRVL